MRPIGYLAAMRANKLLVASVVLGTSLAGMSSFATAQNPRHAQTAQELPRLRLHSPLLDQDGRASVATYTSSLLTVGNFDAAEIALRPIPAAYPLLDVSAYDSVPGVRAHLYQVNNDALVLRPYVMGRTGLRSVATFDALARR